MKFLKIYLLIADHSFSIFFSKLSAILLSIDSIEIIDRSTISMTDSHIKYIVCICVSFLYSSLPFETLHYPWISSQVSRVGIYYVSFFLKFSQINNNIPYLLTAQKRIIFILKSFEIIFFIHPVYIF